MRRVSVRPAGVCMFSDGLTKAVMVMFGTTSRALRPQGHGVANRREAVVGLGDSAMAKTSAPTRPLTEADVQREAPCQATGTGSIWRKGRRGRSGRLQVRYPVQIRELAVTGVCSAGGGI